MEPGSSALQVDSLPAELLTKPGISLRMPPSCPFTCLALLNWFVVALPTVHRAPYFHSPLPVWLFYPILPAISPMLHEYPDLFYRRSPGVGNGNSLQYSCLENLMDRGTWWVIIHRVAESRSQLSIWALTHIDWGKKSLTNWHLIKPLMSWWKFFKSSLIHLLNELCSFQIHFFLGNTRK